LRRAIRTREHQIGWKIINRDFDAVDHTTIVIDTAGQAVEQSLAALQMAVSARRP